MDMDEEYLKLFKQMDYNNDKIFKTNIIKQIQDYFLIFKQFNLNIKNEMMFLKRIYIMTVFNKIRRQRRC